MPAFRAVANISARSLGMTNGEAPPAPVITNPGSDGASTGFPNLIYVGYDVGLSSFPVARVEFRIDLLDGSNAVVDEGLWGGDLGGVTTPSYQVDTIASRTASDGDIESITVDTRYKIYLRSVDTAGQISIPSSPRIVVTQEETYPMAVAPTLTGGSQVSYPTAPYITVSIAPGTAGSFAIGTRAYSVTLSTASEPGAFTTYTGALDTPFNVTTTHDGSAIRAGVGLTGSSVSYKVWVRYTAASPGVGTDTAFAIVTAATEIEPGYPASVSASALSTSWIRVYRGNISNSPTYQVKYQYGYKTSSSGTPSTAYDFGTGLTYADVTGLSSGTTYYFWVRAVSLGPNGSYGYWQGPAGATTSAGTPDAPTLSFSSTSASVRNAAYLSWNAVSGASYYKISYSTDGGSTYTELSQLQYGTSASMSITAGTTRKWKMRAFNSSGVASGYSNVKTMTAGEENKATTWTHSITTPLLDWLNADRDPSCPNLISLYYQFGSVASSSSTAGYKRVDSVSAEFQCGVKPISTWDRTANCNSSNCFWWVGSVTPGATSRGSTDQAAAIGGSNFGATWETRTYTFSTPVGGTALSGKTIWVAPADIFTTIYKGTDASCTPSYNGEYYYARNLVLTGVETTSSTYS